MYKNLLHLPITTIRPLLLHHQIVPISRKSPPKSKKSKPAHFCGVSILSQSQKMSTTSSSSNVTTPQLPVSDDRTTPESGSSLSSSSILAIPAAAVVVEEMVNHPLQEEATIEQSPNKPSPRYADVCSYPFSFLIYCHHLE